MKCFGSYYPDPLPVPSPQLPPSSLSTLSSLFPDNTASIVSRRREVFSQERDQEFFRLVLVVADGGEPPLSSTATLSLRVCVCQRNTRGRNSNNVCQAQAFLSSAGLSTGAFVAILLCIVILLGKYAGTNFVYIFYSLLHRDGIFMSLKSTLDVFGFLPYSLYDIVFPFHPFFLPFNLSCTFSSHCDAVCPATK